MNQVNIIGRITKEIEPRVTPTGITVIEFNIALNGRKDKKGNEKSYFFRCVAYSKTAELIQQWFHKGDRIGISGELIDNSYEKDGHRIYNPIIRVNSIDFLQDKRKQSDQSENESYDTIIDESDLPF